MKWFAAVCTLPPPAVYSVGAGPAHPYDEIEHMSPEHKTPVRRPRPARGAAQQPDAWEVVLTKHTNTWQISASLAIGLGAVLDSKEEEKYTEKVSGACMSSVLPVSTAKLGLCLTVLPAGGLLPGCCGVLGMWPALPGTGL
jgi:hypothetical protein